jgi:hypothetical protein
VFELYTETARRVIFWSKCMAQQLGSPEIETEHLLVGLPRADQVLAVRFLGSPWAVEQVCRAVRDSEPIRDSIPRPLNLPVSEMSKRVLESVPEQASRPSMSRRIGSERLLPVVLHGGVLRLNSDRRQDLPAGIFQPEARKQQKGPHFEPTAQVLHSVSEC